ncbi:MAG: ParB/RepB/Spo0J family partition protein [Bacilli bacterium]|nr:ParB/RepB/Spo0J family partition protein [Bacilli bacterium]
MNDSSKDEVVYLYLDDIIPNRFQPREVFDEKALKELAVSIREHGVIQPIIVRSVNGKYEIIAGERRYKATALAGLTKIPAIIRDLDDKESSKVALLENLQRKNLSPIEEARTFQKILEIDQMTQEELAKTMGKSQSSVANKLRLLSLPDEVQDALLKEQISERHARCLLNIPDVAKQKEMLKKVINNKMSVRLLEEEIKQMYPKEEPVVEEEDNDSVSLENNFVNNNILMPTAQVSLPTDNIGKVRIAPPQEGPVDASEGAKAPEYINFGEINDEDDADDAAPTQLNLDSNVAPVDIAQMKQQAADLQSPSASQSGGLDAMLNIGANPKGATVGGNDFKYLSPAEKLMKESVQPDPEIPSNDYFKPDETLSVDPDVEKIPRNILSDLTIDTAGYTVDKAKEQIKDLVEDLKNHGIKVSSDEMDFDTTYQVIIKIEK